MIPNRKPVWIVAFGSGKNGGCAVRCSALGISFVKVNLPQMGVTFDMITLGVRLADEVPNLILLIKKIHGVKKW